MKFQKLLVCIDKLVQSLRSRRRPGRSGERGITLVVYPEQVWYGGVKVEDGETFYYKRCRVCGHTVRFFFTPRTKATRLEIKLMRERARATLH